MNRKGTPVFSAEYVSPMAVRVSVREAAAKTMSSTGSAAAPEEAAAEDAAALEAALRLLKPGGVIAVALYYGGANGYGERDAVMTWLETLDDRKFSVLRCDWANRRNDPPVPIFIWKE